MFNSVKVTLQNQDIGQISTKEVEVAKYLDMLHTVRIPKEYEEEQLTFDRIV